MTNWVGAFSTCANSCSDRISCSSSSRSFLAGAAPVDRKASDAAQLALAVVLPSTSHLVS